MQENDGEEISPPHTLDVCDDLEDVETCRRQLAVGRTSDQDQALMRLVRSIDKKQNCQKPVRDAAWAALQPTVDKTIAQCFSRSQLKSAVCRDGRDGGAATIYQRRHEGKFAGDLAGFRGWVARVIKHDIYDSHRREKQQRREHFTSDEDRDRALENVAAKRGAGSPPGHRIQIADEVQNQIKQARLTLDRAAQMMNGNSPQGTDKYAVLILELRLAATRKLHASGVVAPPKNLRAGGEHLAVDGRGTWTEGQGQLAEPERHLAGGAPTYGDPPGRIHCRGSLPALGGREFAPQYQILVPVCQTG